MGTNYYLRKRVTVQEYYNYDLYRYDHYHVFDTLENGFVFNNRYYPTEEEVNKVLYVELHIGKASAGWHFGLCIYPELNINNLEDWKREFNVSGNKIYDEYTRQRDVIEDAVLNEARNTAKYYSNPSNVPPLLGITIKDDKNKKEAEATLYADGSINARDYNGSVVVEGRDGLLTLTQACSTGIVGAGI